MSNFQGYPSPSVSIFMGTVYSTRQSSLRGLYPTGEGAGYAGGIMSAAIDGIMTAETIIMEENYERETDQQMAP